MFEVGVAGQFEAAHRLHGDFGPAARTHGHTYRVEVSVRGPALRADGTLLDISRLQRALQEATDVLHFRDLDEVPGLAGRNTTAEVVARYLFDRIAPQIASPELDTLRVQVWESPQAFAVFEDQLA